MNESQQGLKLNLDEKPKKNGKRMAKEKEEDLNELYQVDYEATLRGLEKDPNLIKFIQEGLIDDKNAYKSALVSQIRLIFLLKAALFQILLQALPYSPGI